jgi:hypothetical protein
LTSFTEQSNLTNRLNVQPESIDILSCKGLELAEEKCKKLRMGHVEFSPKIQAARRYICTWSLFVKKKEGMKISKSGIHRSMRQTTIEYLENDLKQAYCNSYKLKGPHSVLANTALENLVEALAEKGDKKGLGSEVTLGKKEAKKIF